MMADEQTDFSQGLEELLDQHDYDTPEIGDIRKGIIVSISPQGVIVDLGLKRDGLVQSADVSKLEPDEREALQVNEEVSVYIVNTDEPDGLIVSIHRARLNQDWIDAEELLESGRIVEAEVIGYNRGGAIVPFGRLRGFIPSSHLSDLSRGLNDRQRQQKLTQLRGKMIPLKVIEVDRKHKRLVLSQRDAEQEWRESQKEKLLDSLQEGMVLKGRVTGLRDFGAFVDIGGADGLIHVSELAWHRVNHPREVIRVGDEVEVYVLKVDRADQRIALSHKRVLPNPWSAAEEKYANGALVEGTITRIVDYGAFVELEPGIEGLLHASQLARAAIKDPREIIREGETHLLRVINVDPDKQRIGLSLKAVTANEQMEWMARRSAEAPPKKERPPRAPRPAPAAPAESTLDEAPVPVMNVAAVVEAVANGTAAEPATKLSQDTLMVASTEEE